MNHDNSSSEKSARTHVNLRGRRDDALAIDGIEMKMLYKDDQGRSTILFRMAPGAVVPLHEHTDLEQTFMLEGSLVDHEGEVTAGNFVWRPGGNIHVAHALHGAVFISMFNRPNRFFDGSKFFTHSPK